MRSEDRTLLDLLCFIAPRAGEFDRAFRLREGWGPVITALRNRGLVAFDSLMPSSSALAGYGEVLVVSPPRPANETCQPAVAATPLPARPRRETKAWADQELRAVEIAHRRGVSISDLAQALGRNYWAVCKRTEGLGYRFGIRPRLTEPPTLAQILALSDPNQPLPFTFARRPRPLHARPREPWSAEKKRAFLETLERTGSIDEAMIAVDLRPASRTCAYRQKRRDAAFSAAWDEALKRSPYRPGRKPPAGPPAGAQEPNPRPRIWADRDRQARFVDALRRTGFVSHALREMNLKGGDQPSRITRQRREDAEFDRRCADAIVAWQAENPRPPKTPAANGGATTGLSGRPGPRRSPPPRSAPFWRDPSADDEPRSSVWASEERQHAVVDALRRKGQVKAALAELDLSAGAVAAAMARQRRVDRAFDDACKQALEHHRQEKAAAQAIAAFARKLKPSARHNPWADPRRQEAFISALLREGAVARALVAVGIGSKSDNGYLSHRKADPVFAAHCDEALREWRAALAPKRPQPRPAPARKPTARVHEDDSHGTRSNTAPVGGVRARAGDWAGFSFRKDGLPAPKRWKSDAEIAAESLRYVEERKRIDACGRRDLTVEEAKLVLQRKGLSVFRSSVAGGRDDRWSVSGMGAEVTDQQLIERAERAQR